MSASDESIQKLTETVNALVHALAKSEARYRSIEKIYRWMAAGLVAMAAVVFYIRLDFITRAYADNADAQQQIVNDMKALANVPLSPCHSPPWSWGPSGYRPAAAKSQVPQNLNCPPRAPEPGEAITLGEAAQDLAILVTNLKWDSDWLRRNTNPSQTVAQELVRMNGMLAAIPPMALEMRKMTIAIGAMTSAVGSMTNSARTMYKILTAVLILLGFIALRALAEDTALDRYVAKPDPHYGFKHRDTQYRLGYTIYQLKMTSQQWRHPGEVDRVLWKHDLIIIEPWELMLNDQSTAILLIEGGSNDSGPPKIDDKLFGLIAMVTRSVVAIVRQVPNQPLRFADEVNRPRKEDDLVAYTLDKYLSTGDEEWPVHLAMTKAAVRAMDAVQSFMASRAPIEHFIVMGGSKRGWTTWLVAAADPRVKAIIPVSIDVLNIDRQLEHQWSSYGFFAPALRAYGEFDIPRRLKTALGQSLLVMIDPYRYRERLTMPKLIMNSTGDQFFLPDASRLYYADLPGPKLLRYSVNTDHRQKDEDAIFTAVSWVTQIEDGDSSPQFSWSIADDGAIRVQASTRPKKVLLWQATNPNARDFRLETLGPAWSSSELHDNGDGTYIAAVPPPLQGWTAFTVQLVFDGAPLPGMEQSYTTDVSIVPNRLPFSAEPCAGTSQPAH
jgi:PhoPQ-activated pathogenicity-related protein